MSNLSSELEPLLARYVEEHVLHGRVLWAADLCGLRVDLIEPLHHLIECYQSITVALDGGLAEPDDLQTGAAPARPLPQFEGFQTIERLGAGGMGEVFKLRDLTLNRIVAGKVIRRDSAAPATSASSCARPARWRSLPTAGSSASSSSARRRSTRHHHGACGAAAARKPVSLTTPARAQKPFTAERPPRHRRGNKISRALRAPRSQR